MKRRTPAQSGPKGSRSAAAPTPTFGLEAARARLPSLVGLAQAGESSIITRHGKPMAALVPASSLASLVAQDSARAISLLQLRGTGQGLWSNTQDSVSAQRQEWNGHGN